MTSPALRRIFLVGFCLSGLATLQAEETSNAEESDQGLRLLFIGNSLTYTNDLPEMLGALLRGSGVAVSEIESEARPDFGLQDHWSSKTSMRTLGSFDWDVVSIQQGPSATQGRPSLLEFSELFATEIRKSGGEPALYMVWPSAARLRDFPGVVDSYQTAALEVDGLLFPVGAAWVAAWLADPKIPLYGRDGFHPSRLGTYLAALVMFQQLSGCDPRNLPASIPGLRKSDPVDPEHARILQQAAFESNNALPENLRFRSESCPEKAEPEQAKKE